MERSNYVGGLASFYHFKFIALLLKVTERCRECIAQFLDRLQRVVEGDDRTIASIEHHIAEHIEGIEQVGIVTCHEVPHHNLVLAPKHFVCPQPHPSVRRTEEMRVDEFIGLLHIIIICDDIMLQAAQMVVCMIAHLMALVDDALIEFGIALDILSHEEEGSLGVKLLERIEDEGCRFRYGTIIEGEIYRMLLWIDSPECFGVYPPKPFGWLFYQHLFIESAATLLVYLYVFGKISDETVSI